MNVGLIKTFLLPRVLPLFFYFLMIVLFHNIVVACLIANRREVGAVVPGYFCISVIVALVLHNIQEIPVALAFAT